VEKKPLYTIGVVADLISVHPETLRVWERHGLLKPHRRNAQRLYTDDDLKRLSFIQELIAKGLNLAFILAGHRASAQSACENPSERGVLNPVGRRRGPSAKSHLKSRICVRDAIIKTELLKR
jgi:DNA-binding transcriptional MerR regulator